MEKTHTSSSYKQPFLHLLITNLFWPQRLSNSFQTLFLWLSNIHYVLILLYFQYAVLSQKETSSSYPTPFQLSAITPLVNILAFTSSQTLIRFLFAVFIIYFAIISSAAGFVITKTLLKQKLSKFQRTITYYAFQVHSSLGFWIATGFFIASLHDSDAKEAINFNDSIRRILYILIVIGSYMIGLFTALFSYDPFPSGNILAMHSSNLQVIDFVTKAINLPIMATQSDGTFALWTFASVSLITSVWRSINLMKDFPYYNPTTMKFSIRMSGIFMILTIANVMGLILKDSLKHKILNFVFIEALLLALAIKLGNIMFHKNLQESIAPSYSKTDSQTKVLKKVFAIQYLFDRAKILSNDQLDIFQLKLLGYLNYYDTIELETISAENPAFFTKKVNLLIQKIYKDAIKRTKENNKIRILLAFHSLQINNNLPSIMPFLTGVLKSKGIDRIIALYFLDQVSQQFEEDSTENVNIKVLLYYEEICSVFSEKIYAVSKLFLKFWETYLGPNLELVNLLNISKQIEKSDEEIQKFWARSVESDKQLSPSLINIYNCYLSIIRNLPEQSLKLRKKYENADFLQRRVSERYGALCEDNLNSLGNIVVHVSLNKDRLGEIRHISSNVQELLKWSREDLLSKNIGILMLPFLKEAHQKILIRLLDEGPRSTIINHNIESFVQTKEGHTVPVHLYLAMHPSIHSLEELTYVLILRLRKPKSEMIVFNESGMIEGATNHISKKFSILGNNRMSIASLCENISDFNTFDSSNSNFLFQKGKSTASKAETPKRRQDDSQNMVLKFRSHNNRFSEEDLHYSASLEIHSLLNTKLYVLHVSYNQKEDASSEGLVSEEADFDEEQLEIPVERDIIDDLVALPPLTTTRGLLSPTRSDNKAQDIVFEFPMGNKKIMDSTEKSESFQRKKFDPNYEKLRDELETGVYSLPKYIESRILIFVYAVVCSLLLVVIYVENKNTLVNIGQNTFIASNWSRQLGNLVQLDHFNFRYIMYEKGIFKNDRYQFMGPSPPLIPSTILRYRATQERIIPIQRALRDHFSEISPKYQKLFFEKFPIYELNSNNKSVQTGESNIFELVDRIIATIDEISSTPTSQIHYTYPPVAFIQENTLNNVLVYGETLINYTILEIENKFDYIRALTTEFVLVAFGLSFLMVFFALYHFRIAVKDKNKISGLILHFDQEAIKRHISVVQCFIEALEKHGMDGRRTNYVMCEKNLEQKSEKTRNSHTYRERFASKRNFHKRELQILLTLSLQHLSKNSKFQQRGTLFFGPANFELFFVLEECPINGTNRSKDCF